MTQRITAQKACAEYELIAAEVGRLTLAIGAEECPNEHYPDVESCFTRAKNQTTDADNWMPGHSDRPLDLDEIEEEVEECPSCMRLIGLIRERKEARKQFGAAKRRVRTIGKRVIAEEPSEEKV